MRWSRPRAGRVAPAARRDLERHGPAAAQHEGALVGARDAAGSRVSITVLPAAEVEVERARARCGRALAAVGELLDGLQAGSSSSGASAVSQFGDGVEGVGPADRSARCGDRRAAQVRRQASQPPAPRRREPARRRVAEVGAQADVGALRRRRHQAPLLAAAALPARLTRPAGFRLARRRRRFLRRPDSPVDRRRTMPPAARVREPCAHAPARSAPRAPRRCRAEVLPPLGQLGVDLAGVGAQAQEVEAGAEARLLHQPNTARAAAALEARLHHPDLAHVGGQLAAPEMSPMRASNGGVDGLLQRRERRLAACAARCQRVLHVVPEHAGQQEARRDRLALADAAVGVGQRGWTNSRPSWRRSSAPRRAPGTRRGAGPACAVRDARQRMASLQQL